MKTLSNSLGAPVAVTCSAGLGCVPSDYEARLNGNGAGGGSGRSLHLVMFSGGVGSWATAKRVAERHGAENMVLLFADTMMEDEDLYRFLGEAVANIGAPMVRLADGRHVWELFLQNHTIGNGKVDLCSRELKRDLLDKWRNANCDPEKTTIYIGIDWTEEHRLRRAQECGAPWQYAAPMCEPPYMDKAAMLAWLKAEGIEPPRLYKMGFPHNNCGGFCVKAGHAQFALLLRTMPERYRWHEEWEARVRADQESRGIVPSSVLYHRRGGPRTRITLREFREQMETQPDLLDAYDWGGCGCALDSEPVRLGGGGGVLVGSATPTTEKQPTAGISDQRG